MKVAFWSNVHGQSAITSNLLATILMCVIDKGKKCLLTQSHFEMNNLEIPLIGTSNVDDSFLDVGIDALTRSIKSAPPDREAIMDCCLSLLGQKLSLLPCTSKANRDLFEQDMQQSIARILNYCNQYYDIVAIDTNTGRMSDTTDIIFNEMDLIVVNLCQNMGVIEDFFQGYYQKMKEKNILFLLGNYDKNSSCNVKNLIRSRKEFTNKNLFYIPYNTDFLDASNHGHMITFIMRNVECDQEDSNYEFIAAVKRIANTILDERR